jgi:tetratricopeptide (TPR) repeat protein
MERKMFSKLGVVTLITGIVVAAACSRSGAERARRFADDGDRFMTSGRYNAAVIEYRNAIKSEPTWATGHARLATAFLAIGKTDDAYREFSNAIELDATDTRSRLEAGRLLFGAHMYQESQIRAEQVLDREARNVDALVLLARSYAAAALETGDRDGAEAVLRGIVRQEPSAVEARVALGDFLATTARPYDAERQLIATVHDFPADELANRSLASFYLSTGRRNMAEPYLKAAAIRKDQRYQSSLAFADYLTEARRFDEARVTLEAAKNDGAQGTGARVRLAAIEDEIGSPEAARKILDGVLKKNATPEALALNAQLLLLREKKTQEAWQAARAALDQDPHMPAANYVAGTIDLDRGHLDDADHAFREAMRSSRLAAAASLQLARTRLAMGKPAEAVDLAEAAGSGFEARVTLARALVATGDEPRARAELARLAAERPRAPEPAILLATLDLNKGDAAAARQHADRALAAAPDSADALLVAGQAALAADDAAAAESLLARAAARNPSSFDANTLLAQLYVSRGEHDRARSMFDSLTSRYPSAAAPRTASGIILDATGHPAEARAAFEQAIALDPGDSVAAAYLARFYVADPARADEALALARTAAAAAPDEPDVHDTLGWAYYKTGRLRPAAAELEQALLLKPNDATYRQHLDEVRRALESERKESVARTGM